MRATGENFEGKNLSPRPAPLYPESLSSAFEPLSTQSLAVFSPFLAKFCVFSLMLSFFFHVRLCELGRSPFLAQVLSPS